MKRRGALSVFTTVALIVALCGLGTPAAAATDLYTVTDLGAFGGYDINRQGQVVGCADFPGESGRAYLWTQGRTTELGTLGGATACASGINDRGQVAGYVATAGGETRAFLWDNGRMTDLNRLLPAGSGWVLRQAYAINDAGQIVGFGEVNGQRRGFLLSPRR